METKSITLAADGSSDRCLIHPIRWAIRELLRKRGRADIALELVFADVAAIPLKHRIREALQKYPCDILLVHRDAEKEPAAKRLDEIAEALRSFDERTAKIGVVPIRMSEAWLLINEGAIRMAAGNPNGKVALDLPKLRDLESNPDPKKVLRDAILTASEETGRRRSRLQRDLSLRVQRVAQLIEDYSLLKRLSAFRHFEIDLEEALQSIGLMK